MASLLPQRRRGGTVVTWSGAAACVGRRRRASVAVRASYEAGVGVMATKVGMMTYFDPETGKPVPVTVVGFREGGNVVTQVKTAATDGYDAVQVGYHGVREDKLTRPELGHLGKAGAPPLKHLQEFRLTAVDAFEPGQPLDFADLFKEGDIIDVSGNTIGKGFQGTPIFCRTSIRYCICNASNYPHFLLIISQSSGCIIPSAVLGFAAPIPLICLARQHCNELKNCMPGSSCQTLAVACICNCNATCAISYPTMFNLLPYHVRVLDPFAGG